uniref:Uncharacterized protein n=1 Tax=Naja naja TaxID=35670 RepID=A0A8C7E6U4_NAJNA
MVCGALPNLCILNIVRMKSLLSSAWKYLNENTRLSLENNLNWLITFDPFKTDVDNCNVACLKSESGCFKCGIVMMEHADEAFKICGGVGLFFSFIEILKTIVYNALQKLKISQNQIPVPFYSSLSHHFPDFLFN